MSILKKLVDDIDKGLYDVDWRGFKAKKYIKAIAQGSDTLEISVQDIEKTVDKINSKDKDTNNR